MEVISFNFSDTFLNCIWSFYCISDTFILT